ncbi:ATP-binding protein, partial [Candidatus Woesearchaeota archaeon]|nr:ATP-binding protein [Candidatus Woesearchaeota archaeon]
MNEKKSIELPEILALVKLIKENRLDSDNRINALLNCVIADNYDIASYNLLVQSVQPYIVEQALRENPFPPPSEAIDGDIRFGFSEGNQLAGFMPDELHVLIAGEPGTGKTTIANFFIAPQAMIKEIKCWFFVKARDTEKLISMSRKQDIIAVDFDEQIKLNIMQAPKNVSRHEWYANLWDMFIQAEAIFDGTKNFLIEQSYDLAGEYEGYGFEPSLFELYDYIKSKNFQRGTRNINYAESA